MLCVDKFLSAFFDLLSIKIARSVIIEIKIRSLISFIKPIEDNSEENTHEDSSSNAPPELTNSSENVSDSIEDRKPAVPRKNPDKEPQPYCNHQNNSDTEPQPCSRYQKNPDTEPQPCCSYRNRRSHSPDSPMEKEDCKRPKLSCKQRERRREESCDSEAECSNPNTQTGFVTSKTLKHYSM